MSDTNGTPRKPFLERQRDRALAEITEQRNEFRRVAELVVPSDRRGSSQRVTNVIRLGDDHLVEVTDRDDSVMWTFVVAGKSVNWYHHTQEDAILHLIASRYDSNPNSSHVIAFCAGRVLGLPAH